MREASLNENVKRTAIHHRSIFLRGSLAGGSAPKMLQYIPPPPKDWGMLNIYLPSQEAPQRWRGRMPEQYLMGVWGGYILEHFWSTTPRETPPEEN